MDSPASGPSDPRAPIRVLHDLDSVGTGGVEILLYHYYMEMDRSRIVFDFAVHTSGKGLVEEWLEKEGVRVYHIKPRFKRLLALIAQTRRIIKDGGYQVVHAHNTARSFPQLFAAWTCGVKVRIAHSHDVLFFRGLRRLQFAVYNWLTRLFATDYFACGEMAGRYVFGQRVDGPRYRMVRNAIHTGRFAYDETRRAEIRRRHHAEGRFVLLCVGRFHPQKNHVRLLPIFAKVRELRPDACLFLVGEGELESAVRAQARELGLGDSVVFAGKTPDIPSYLSAADVFVLPSLHEGLPVVLVEAQASGLPCVVSENVTRESNLLDLVRFVSLDAPDGDWARAICEAKAPARTDAAEKLARAGYSVEEEAGKLQDWYIRRVREAEGGAGTEPG